VVRDSLEHLHLAGAAVALLTGVEASKGSRPGSRVKASCPVGRDRDALPGELHLEGIVEARQLRRGGALGGGEALEMQYVRRR